MLEQLWRDTAYPRAKEKPQKDCRRGKITFGIKYHIHQRCSEDSNTPCVHQDPETPQRLRQDCVWVSPEEVWVSSGLLQGLWVQQSWVRHKPSWKRLPLTPPLDHRNLHKTGETDSWRAQTKSCGHEDPGGRSSDPTKDWPRLACECPGVSARGMGWWWPAAVLEALSVAVSAMGPFEGGSYYLHSIQFSWVTQVIIFITSTIVWPQVK